MEPPAVQSNATRFTTFKLKATSDERERQEVHNPNYQSSFDENSYNKHKYTSTYNFPHNHHIRHVTAIDTRTDNTTDQYGVTNNDDVLHSLPDHGPNLEGSRQTSIQDTVLTTDATPDIVDKTHNAFQVAEPTLPSRFDRDIDQVLNEQERPCHAVRSEQCAQLVSEKAKANPSSPPTADAQNNQDTQSTDQRVPLDSNTVDPIVFESPQAHHENGKTSYTIEMNTILTTPGAANVRTDGQCMVNSCQPPQTAIQPHEINTAEAMVLPPYSLLKDQEIIFDTVLLLPECSRPSDTQILEPATVYSTQDIQVTKIETEPVIKVQIKSTPSRIPQPLILCRQLVRLKLACFSILSYILLLVFSALAFVKGRIQLPANSTSLEDNRQEFSSSFTTGLPQGSADTWTSPNANFIALLEQNSVPLTRATNNTSIEGQIYGQNLTFLIHTGANVTAIRADVWRRIPELARSKPEPTPMIQSKQLAGPSCPC